MSTDVKVTIKILATEFSNLSKLGLQQKTKVQYEKNSLVTPLTD